MRGIIAINPLRLHRLHATHDSSLAFDSTGRIGTQGRQIPTPANALWVVGA